mmetsp:Transcript_10438/g.18799  ORF Transcript_10438/g.18799 Transcript_10438/m.18799 type:complete len:223 (+) Transcript_10438:75-743(+)
MLMMWISALAIFNVLSLAAARVGSKPQCPAPEFSTVADFDLQTFVSQRWYIQQQMPVSYLPASRNKCVYAEYSLKEKKSLLGYDIDVHNHAEDVNTDPGSATKSYDANLCAKIVDAKNGKLEVAPCFVPSALSGPYWVVDYSEAEGYAIISGGAPSISTDSGCRTGSGVNNAGFWIFTRKQERDERLVQKARAVAAGKGFDLSVLNDVDQTSCAGALVDEDM